MVEWLIASGRDLGDIDFKGRLNEGFEYSAVEIVRERKNAETVLVLKRFLANPELTRQEIRKDLHFTSIPCSSLLF